MVDADVQGFFDNIDHGTALGRAGQNLQGLRLELRPTKTRLVELGLGKEGFDFLGCHPRIVRSHFKGRNYLFRWPSRRAMKSVRAKVHDLTTPRRWAGLKDIREVIAEVNPILRGWGNYFRTGNASGKFNAVERCVRERLLRLPVRRGGQRRPDARRLRPVQWPHRRFVNEHGLYRLLGTIRYPGGRACRAWKPSVRRMRETRTYGLNGVRRKRSLQATAPEGLPMNTAMSRLSSLADDSGSGAADTHLEDYTYLDLHSLVTRAHAQTGIDLTWEARQNASGGFCARRSNQEPRTAAPGRAEPP